MLISRIGDVLRARPDDGGTTDDALVLQLHEQRAVIRKHLQLLCMQHRQLCCQQQEALAAWTALAVGSAAWVGAWDQMQAQQRRRQAMLREIRMWAERHTALLPTRPAG